MGLSSRILETKSHVDFLLLVLYFAKPYWSALSPDPVADKATYKNNGDLPATVVYTETANTILLDSTVIVKAASGQSIIALTIRVTDSSVSVTDSSGANCLYKCSTSSTFALVPVGYATILGATAKVTRRWRNACVR